MTDGSSTAEPPRDAMQDSPKRSSNDGAESPDDRNFCNVLLHTVAAIAVQALNCCVPKAVQMAKVRKEDAESSGVCHAKDGIWAHASVRTEGVLRRDFVGMTCGL